MIKRSCLNQNYLSHKIHFSVAIIQSYMIFEITCEIHFHRSINFRNTVEMFVFSKCFYKNLEAEIQSLKPLK